MNYYVALIMIFELWKDGLLSMCSTYLNKYTFYLINKSRGLKVLHLLLAPIIESLKGLLNEHLKDWLWNYKKQKKDLKI